MALISPQDEQAWAEQFGVTPAQIRDAVQAVGTSKSDVELYLKGSRSSTDQEVTRAANANGGTPPG